MTRPPSFKTRPRATTVSTSLPYAKPSAAGTGDCLSWANACPLRTALTNATSGDQIWVAAGAHTPSATGDRTATFQLKNGVAVYGGFPNVGDPVFTDRNPAVNVTVLSGDLNGDDVGFNNNGENSNHVVMGATGATLDGVTISGGNADWSYSSYQGGGMYNSGSSPALSNVVFSGNTAYSGGGMYNTSSSPTLSNVTFSGNTAYAGGGMYNPSSSPTLSNVTFSGNSATYGGAIYNYYGHPVLSNVTFSGNSATYGGGMFNDSSHPQVRNSILWGDSGDEIRNNNATPTVADSVVQGGYASGTNIITADPLLGTLGNYGGSLQTFPLRPGSSAIDAGNPTYCTIGHDQRGVSYVGTCDIGAFESQGFVLTTTGGGDQTTVINTAFAQPLALTVTPNDAGEPVNNGVVTFAGPLTGASTNPITNTATIAAGGVVSQSVTANGTAGGPYNVTASAAGAASVSFALANVCGIETVCGTATNVTSVSNPSTYGQTVVITATVTSGGGPPTGAAAFKDNGTDITGCAAQSLNASGQATCSTSALAAGVHANITVVYGGNAYFSSSTSAAYSQTVNPASTTTTLTSSAYPSTYSQTVVFTATVTGGGGTPTGAVAFKDDGTDITGCAAQSLNAGGQATCSTSALAVGLHANITAGYHGDSNFNGSSSAAYSQTVNRAGTTTTLSSSANPSVIGQAVTFTATVNGASPTGVVTFKDGGTNVTGCVNLASSGGSAVCQVASPVFGTHAITADYSGDASNQASSGLFPHVVNKASTTTSMIASVNPSLVGNIVTFTVTVSTVAPGSGTPTGTVDFYEITVPSASNRSARRTAASPALVGGQATFSASGLTVGAHNLQAQYSGDANYSASNSAAYPQTVNQRIIQYFLPMVSR